MAQEPAPPLLPSAATVVGAAKARLLEVRPSAAPHIEKGRYAVPFIGFRGQFVVARGRLAEEVRAARLRFSEGDVLTELAASNYDTPRAATGPVVAIGIVLLVRNVAHWLPSASVAITAANATDEATLLALLTNIYTVFNAHAASVYSAGTGAGAHQVAETETLSAPVTSNAGNIASTLNTYKETINEHLVRASLGTPLQPHLTADSESVIDIDDAFASDAGAAYSAQTGAAQQSMLLLGNAIKAAFGTHFRKRALAGTIRVDTRIRIEANPTAVPPIEGGEVVVSETTYVRTGVRSVLVPVRASVPGPAGNQPVFLAASSPRTPTVKLLGSLYDAAETWRFAPTLVLAAGGTDGQPDALLKRAAAAGWQGSYGPTDQALVAGALRFPGVARCPILKDRATGTSVLYPVDESWAQSTTWTAALEQALKDDWLGVGCRIAFGAVLNRVVRVELAVVLRERRFLSDTTAITAALEGVVRAYFEDRPDFWVFRLAALRAAASRGHSAILKCVTATVRDADGIPLTEPSQPSVGAAIFHWWFAGGLEVVYDAPTV